MNGPTTLKPPVQLPPYPFAHKHIPYYPPSSELLSRRMRARKGPLNYVHMALNASTHPDLAQHVIRGESILPATGFLEMVDEDLLPQTKRMLQCTMHTEIHWPQYS